MPHLNIQEYIINDDDHPMSGYDYKKIIDTQNVYDNTLYTIGCKNTYNIYTTGYNIKINIDEINEINATNKLKEKGIKLYDKINMLEEIEILSKKNFTDNLFLRKAIIPDNAIVLIDTTNFIVYTTEVIFEAEEPLIYHSVWMGNQIIKEVLLKYPRLLSFYESIDDNQLVEIILENRQELKISVRENFETYKNLIIGFPNLVELLFQDDYDGLYEIAKLLNQTEIESINRKKTLDDFLNDAKYEPKLINTYFLENNIQTLNESHFEIIEKFINVNYKVAEYIPDYIKYTENMLTEWFENLIIKLPELIEYSKILSEKICDIAIEYDARLIRFIPDNFQTIDRCLKAIQHNPISIKYIRNKTYEMCSLAVLHNTNMITEIPDEFKSNDLMMHIYKHDIKYITQFRNIPIKILLDLAYSRPNLLMNISTIKYHPELDKIITMIPNIISNIVDIPNEVFMSLIKENKNLANFIDINILPNEIINELLVANPGLIVSIKNPSYDMWKLALTVDGMLIIHIDDKILDINLMRIAINNDIRAFRLIKNQPDELCIEVIKKDPTQIQFIMNIDADLWKKIVDIYPEGILHRETITYDLCIYVLDKNPNLLKEIVIKLKLTPKIIKSFQDILTKYVTNIELCNEITFYLLKKYPNAIEFLNKTNTNALISIYNNDNNIKYINSGQYNIAILLNPNIIKHIKDAEIRKNMYRIIDNIELFL